MELTERKKMILKAIVDDYIKTAEPVGSKTIAEKSSLGFSSATIRNEMSELEELGYLEKPHTSAGRVPSPTGYRLYVNELMNLEKDDTAVMVTGFDAIAKMKIKELDKIVSEAGKLIAKLTDYTAVAITPSLDQTTIIKFEIITVDPRSFVIVVVTSAGVVKNKLVRTEREIAPEEVELLNYVLNQSLTQIPLTAITAERFDIVRRAAGITALLAPLAQFIAEILEEFRGNKVYLEGASKILNFPEYQNPHKAQLLLDFISDNSNLPAKSQIVHEIDGIQIMIGPENGEGPLAEASTVYASYNIGNMGKGLIGIVGPTRMDYGQLSKKLAQFAKELDKLIAQSFTEDGGTDE